MRFFSVMSLPAKFQPGLCPPWLYPVDLQSVCDAGSDVWVEEPLQVSISQHIVPH